MMRIRPGTSRAFVAPSTQIRNDVRSMRALTDAVEELNAMTGGEILFQIDPEPQPDTVTFELVIDPNDPSLVDRVVGVARRRYSGWNIVGGTVVLDSIEIARRSTTHHELGHMVGLGHSASVFDVMYPYLRRHVETFSPRERLGVRLLLKRPAANRYPDNDRNVTSPRSLVSEWSSVTVCYR